jgi:predicted dithiol-disulfide oxidoreductase (DUF899 family)
MSEIRDEIAALEGEIFELTQKLHALRKANRAGDIPNYTFETQNGQTTLLDLFGDRDTLMLIHNMGQGCRWCTVWADGFNGFLPHLESALSVVLVSKDTPEAQRRFANARGWRFRLASHGGGAYIEEQSVQDGVNNMPGVVVYERQGETITRKNSAVFGPGDLYCSMWHLLALAGLGESEFTPQFSYWRRPETLDDGGENVLD